MENFNSSRIAINERYYKSENDRIFEGGIWAECTVAHNEVEEDDYAFYIEELKPIQLSKFDFEAFVEGQRKFTADEWLDVLIRSFGLEPGWMTKRLKFHYLARLAPLVEPNFNFIELGPRGNGKSYTFSEFSPYATLLGAPTSAATLDRVFQVFVELRITGLVSRMEHFHEGADCLEHGSLITLVIARAEFGPRLHLRESVGLSRDVMECLGQEFDDHPVTARQVLILVLRNLPAGHEGVEAVENRQIEDWMQRLEQVVLV